MSNEKPVPAENPENKPGMEGIRHYYDFYKHLTTLSTGSILLMVAFLEKIFTYVRWQWLVGLSFFFLMASIFASLFTMESICGLIQQNRFSSPKDKKHSQNASFFASVSFWLGLAALSIFGLINFFWPMPAVVPYP